MLFAVGFTKMELDVFNTNDLTRERIKLMDIAKYLKDNGLDSIQGINLLQEDMSELIASGDYEKVLCVDRVVSRRCPFGEKDVVLVCSNERPYINKSVYTVDKPDFKLYFKSGVALVIWHRGYLYNITFGNGMKAVLNGETVDLNIVPRSLAYACTNNDGESYSLYLYNKWLEVHGDRLLCTLNHGVYYGKRGNFDMFKQVVSHYTGK